MNRSSAGSHSPRQRQRCLQHVNALACTWWQLRTGGALGIFTHPTAPTSLDKVLADFFCNLSRYFRKLSSDHLTTTMRTKNTGGMYQASITIKNLVFLLFFLRSERGHALTFSFLGRGKVLLALPGQSQSQLCMTNQNVIKVQTFSSRFASSSFCRFFSNFICFSCSFMLENKPTYHFLPRHTQIEHIELQSYDMLTYRLMRGSHEYALSMRRNRRACSSTFLRRRDALLFFSIQRFSSRLSALLGSSYN